MNYTIEYADDGTRYIENQVIKGSIKLDVSKHGVWIRNCNFIGPFDGAAIVITGKNHDVHLHGNSIVSETSLQL